LAVVSCQDELYSATTGSVVDETDKALNHMQPSAEEKKPQMSR